MNQDAASLDRLHDIALPPVVSWWPVAPGWQVFFSLIIFATSWLAWRRWKAWQAGAYRRIALRELAGATEIRDIAELLRRTALACAPRQEIAKLTGPDWSDWLSRQCPMRFPEAVGEQLWSGVYGRGERADSNQELRAYARHWIMHHRIRNRDPSS